jgi:hypothetical protein
MERQTSPYDSLSRDQLIDLVVELEAQNRARAARITALEEQVRRLLEDRAPGRGVGRPVLGAGQGPISRPGRAG